MIGCVCVNDNACECHRLCFTNFKKKRRGNANAKSVRKYERVSVTGGYRLAVLRNHGHISQEALLSTVHARCARQTIASWENALPTHWRSGRNIFRKNTRPSINMCGRQSLKRFKHNLQGQHCVYESHDCHDSLYDIVFVDLFEATNQQL